MDNSRVIHNTLGEGRLIAKHNGGRLWEVAFSGGQKYVLSGKSFEAAATLTVPAAHSEQFYRRRTLEALRMGIVPLENVSDLTIGLEQEAGGLDRALKRTIEHGGDVMAIIADYGFGKSHFIELAARKALEKNFIVTVASLDLVEVPPAKAREIYRSLIRSLRYSDTDARGLGHLLRRAVENPAVIHQFAAARTLEACPLSAALLALCDCSSQTAFDDVIDWISGTVVNPSAESKSCLKKPPKLYVTGEIARQYSYLLSGISLLATLLGYSGLATFIDESEHYSLLKAAQRGRADSFFQSMIYAAVGPDSTRIDVASIPTHLRADYPPAFDSPAHLFFLFATTDSEDRMPLETWLIPSQCVRLDDRFLKEDILKFSKVVLRDHGTAYSYVPSAERYKAFVENLSALLSRALDQHRINLRQLIQMVVTVCDLLFLHPDYAPETLIAEVRVGLGL